MTGARSRRIASSSNGTRGDVPISDYGHDRGFLSGGRMRRDRWLREKLRTGTPPWTVVELRARNLKYSTKVMKMIDLH